MRMTVPDRAHAAGHYMKDHSRYRELRAGLTLVRSGRETSQSLAKLRDLWGGGAAARPNFLASSLSLARLVGGNIMECGSGLSTLVLGQVSHRITALEESPAHARRTRGLGGLYTSHPRPTIQLAPLMNYGSFSWYDVDPSMIPPPRVVICDGPYGDLEGRLPKRYGLLPFLASLELDEVHILLDDTDRTGERQLIELWKDAFGVVVAEDMGDHMSLFYAP